MKIPTNRLEKTNFNQKNISYILFFLLFALLFHANKTSAESESSSQKKGKAQVSLGDESTAYDPDDKALGSEAMIANTEEKAISAMQKLLYKKKGQPEEADMWFRLAELYMRRAKSERFFNLFLNEKTQKISMFPSVNTGASGWIKKAAEAYNKIEKEFKNYPEMDTVLFANAFAHQQLGKLKESENLYNKLVSNFPNSIYLPDALASLAELNYDQRKFAMANEYYLQIEKHPDWKVFPYATYKMAWSYYNLKNSDKGIQKLLEVVKMNPPTSDQYADMDSRTKKIKQNLRREALRDLTIFIGDVYAANDIYPFFKKICTEEELGIAMIEVAKLYSSYSRYRDMSVFLDIFVKEHPDNPYRVRAHLQLVDAYEVLKTRDKVITELKTASDLCVTNSTWRLKQNKEVPDESCQQDFRRSMYDLGEKWWEVWLKNKAHLEFTALTEKLLHIIIENEDLQKRDLKTHYAYAELLFNLGRFSEAAEQYHLVAKNILDKKIQHDASYSALFSIEKHIDSLTQQIKSGKLEKGADKAPLLLGQRKDFSKYYVDNFPSGDHFFEVQMKLASIFFEENNLDAAEPWIQQLLLGKGGPLLKQKAEDLQLDIYNSRKQYDKLRDFSQNLLKDKTISADRKKDLKKILFESAYADLQQQIKNGDKISALVKLSQYNLDYPDSPLAVEALWQAIGIYYSEGQLYSGAMASLNFISSYPKDKRSADLLKEAAAHLALTGHLAEAAKAHMKLADQDPKNKNALLELAADFFALEEEHESARKIYNQLLLHSDTSGRSRIFSKLLLGFKENSKESDKLRQQILSLNIEPYTSQILLERAQKELSEHKYAAAFESARKITARDTNPQIKASARLIQARILEDELIKQSVKSTKEDKLALVISMKSEKLEKALSAYLGAAKMSPDNRTQLESLSGIDRCYQNFIESFKNIQLPPSLSDEDQKNIRKELLSVTAPMDEKRKENGKQILKLSKAKVLSEKYINFAEVGVDKHLSPRPRYPSWQALNPYLPANQEIVFSKIKRIESANKCPDKAESIVDASNCYLLGQKNINSREFQQFNDFAKKFAEHKKTQALGLYLLSLSAERNGKINKSLWLTDQALGLEPQSPQFMYQRARLVYRTEGLEPALQNFDKVLSMQMNSTEMDYFLAVKAYSEGDFETSLSKLSPLSTDQVYNSELGLLLTESLAQSSQVDKALRLLDTMLAKSSGDMELYVQKAQLLEFFKMAPVAAMEVYQKIKSISQDKELLDWVNRKLEYLNQKMATKK